MDKPFLSVVMPVHGGAEWIRATLESVAAEPTRGLEIIVIDSSPSDDTSAIVREFEGSLPLRLIERRDLCPWQQKTNQGVELAGADYVCILHQDDLWCSGRVSAVRSWIADYPDAVLHLAPTRIIDRHGRRLGRWTCPLPEEQVLTGELVLTHLVIQNFVSVPAPVFRRDTWLRCGGMDDRLWYTPDWDMWLKLSGAGPVVYHREFTTSFRVHANSLTVTGSRDAAEFREQMEIVLNRHLDNLPPHNRKAIEASARASINVNVSLATAATALSSGKFHAIASAMLAVVSLGPSGIIRYLRDSRIFERLAPRVRSQLSGAF